MNDAAPLPANPWARYGWAMSAIWLVFLGFAVYALVVADRPLWLRVTGLVLLAAFAVVYVHAFARRPTYDGTSAAVRSAARHLGVMVGLGVVLFWIEGGAGLATLPYVAALAVLTLPLRWAVGVIAAAVVVPLVLPWTGRVPAGDREYALIVLGVAVAAGLVRFLDERDGEWRRMQREYEIVAERERVARDVHDVLGHSLTVLAAKAELAERVLDADPERARDELRQIQSLTRESIAEIRATVAGLRVARLADELEGARTALVTAGIEADVPGAPEVVDPRHRLVLAWVLREAVTNVVRHSGARHCVVTLADHGLTVVDDGAGVAGATEGNGLRGVRERVAAAGGTVSLAAAPDGGTRLEVRL